MADSITAGLARLSAFTKAARGQDAEDVGEEIDNLTVAGGGHSSRPTEITSHQLTISHALKSFLADNHIVSKRDAALEMEGLSPALVALLSKPHIQVPPELTDRSHPLTEYFISSSHNTYLLGHQLRGQSSAAAYESALMTGARCVEIDAWDHDENEDEPKVTHGYTLVSNIPFRAVCEAIRDVVDKEAAAAVDQQGYRAAPIILSLENHCGAHGQMRLVEIMNEVWGDRLLSKAVREKGHREQEVKDEQIHLDELGSKIVLIVEYFFPTAEDKDGDDSNSSSEDEDDEEKQARAAYKARKKAVKNGKIIPELAALGVYAQSVKPRDNSWYESELIDAPHHHLINVSESGLQALMPANSEKIARHNAKYLMRVYPKGTRISSKNLAQVPFWAVGAQICAMNWQTFGGSMQLNEAMFSETEGYVLKPAALRAGGSGQLNNGRRRKLRLHIAGASNVPVPEGRDAEDIKPYVTCSLVHPDDVNGKHQKRKTKYYRQHKLEFLHRGENPPPTDPIWDDILEWEYDDNELVFLRIFIKDDISFEENPIYALTAVRLLYVVPGWSFIRLLDLKGHETRCSLFVKFDFETI
ncbi:1-phosphatidylinositol-4,5-bisphosphate phosphodiesterase [Xylaria bambusicola]|uniref:1-phosphatidylinositol-4,5-bisphosphate phosphodiesterase n=1 Tax=Xylaria bambusicola TaxID=326684 RepID=UPI00200828A0|nr:1-phosphatidylinositol-4,5-bisphosphate phosphodiesterase [Xylaria bambusicola]KAI0521310.1 1-phosphatidylinositol-4,5-bisphosphate phosphodiesterase [Xylaria bambusicola]